MHVVVVREFVESAAAVGCKLGVEGRVLMRMRVARCSAGKLLCAAKASAFMLGLVLGRQVQETPVGHIQAHVHTAARVYSA